jgi:hypothetical protein
MSLESTETCAIGPYGLHELDDNGYCNRCQTWDTDAMVAELTRLRQELAGAIAQRDAVTHALFVEGRAIEKLREAIHHGSKVGIEDAQDAVIRLVVTVP